MSSTLQGASALTAAFNSGAFVAGSSAFQFSNAAAINYTINGRFYSRAIIASQAPVIEPGAGINPVLPQAFVNLAAGQSCAYALLLDTAGAFTVMQGPIVDAGQLCSIPQSPANKVIVGAIKVSNATNPFILGTTSFAAAGVTTTYINLAGHPGTTL